ncbi:DUF6090 family protein [Algoriphagus pacificus]|uniref:Uncharacterized protein n=1 Tax=Algoriphagus pacificus TaxID=2811234 RepID=A0ABS3CJI4_9BACT|nr:DUF6090 family protein [Algoriphagus pacificus]MBN7815814.1 hypothetical protein [Algoriphagus pacificus]
MENKTGKYFKYAIGEIVLVVIGILIALQINNWNEQRKDNIKEQGLLKQLQEDYQSNLLQLEEKMVTREISLNSAVKLLNAFDESDGVVKDSVIKDLANIRHDPTFDPIKNNLTSSENLRLIRNNELRRLLSNWSSDVVGVTEVETTWSNLVNEQYHPIISELGLGRDIYNSFVNDTEHNWLLDKNSNSFKSEIGISKLSAPLNEMLINKELESMISASIVFNRGANLQSEALRQRILEILELIAEEIK